MSKPIVDAREIKPSELFFTIKQDKNFIIISCSHNIGHVWLKEHYMYNRFFRTALISARVEEVALRGKDYWLVGYDECESCQHAKIAKRELVELYPYFYDDKIVLSKFKLRFD
jgi:hypothetical protein